MENDAKYPQRKSPRAPWHDYSTGLYFITIVTRNRNHYFGTISDGQFEPSAIGRFAASLLQQAESHGSQIRIPRFVVMPNHVHFIIYIEDNHASRRTCGAIEMPNGRSALTNYVIGFKSAITRHAKSMNLAFGWQTRYHDHIIRGRSDWDKIDAYIVNNVKNWEHDIYHQPLARIPHTKT